MSTQITTAFVKQFSDSVMILQQQKKTVLRSGVRVESINGEEAFYDQLGEVEFSEVTTRHADTVLEDTPHTRRHVTTSTFHRADLIDRPDMVRTLINPQSRYVSVFAMGAGRKTDQVLIDAAFAVAKTGKSGGTSVSFPAGQIVPTQTMSTTHLADGKQILDENECDHSEGYCLAWTARQERELLTEEIGTAGAQFAPAASSDFGSGSALQAGSLSYYMGINFKRTELLTLTGTDRECIMWARNSLLLAVGIEPRVDIGPRRDKRMSTQVMMELDIGATRMDEVGVVQQLCDES